MSTHRIVFLPGALFISLKVPREDEADGAKLPIISPLEGHPCVAATLNDDPASEYVEFHSLGVRVTVTRENRYSREQLAGASALPRPT